MKKKILLLLLSACLCLSCAGCSPSALFNAKSLMSPPRANEDQQAIQRLLQGDRQEITFVYPKSGEYRSAIIMQNYGGSGKQGAIGFSSLEEGGVEVQFLSKTDAGWATAAAFQNSAMQVDRVLFADLTGSGVNSVLIGWGSAAGVSGRTASVSAYIYSPLDGAISEYPLGFYGEMAVSDINRDGLLEVFTVDKFLPSENEGEEASPAKARVYAWREGGMKEIAEAEADNSITSYSQAVFGKLTSTVWGVALDGVKADASLTTQLFYFDEKQKFISAPGNVNTEEYGNPFTRPSVASFLSRDINGDGSLEIPKAVALPCLPEDAALDSTSYLVEWCAYQESTGSRTVLRALMNSAENYWFRLPSLWNGKITASNDAAHRTVTYTSVTESPETGEKLLGAPLFAVRVFPRSAWESWGESGGYEQVAAQNDVIYGLQILTKDRTALSYIEWIKRDFRLLSE